MRSGLTGIVLYEVDDPPRCTRRGVALYPGGGGIAQMNALVGVT